MNFYTRAAAKNICTKLATFAVSDSSVSNKGCYNKLIIFFLIVKDKAFISRKFSYKYNAHKTLLISTSQRIV